MAVYMIRAGEAGPVKIGHAKSPAKRLAGFQCHHHETLTLLRTIPGGQPEEALLHRYFADLRIRGEWFRFSAEMLAIEVEALRPISFCTHSRIPAEQTNSGRIIDVLGGVARTSQITGASRTAVYNWVKDGIPYRHWPAVRAKVPAITDEHLKASRPSRSSGASAG